MKNLYTTGIHKLGLINLKLTRTDAYREVFISEYVQKVHMYNVSYTKCLASEDFEYIETKAGKTSGNEYKLVFNLLMINKGHYRIYLPPSLVGVLLSLTHLLGHQGLTRMLKDMQSYYFPHMSSITKKRDVFKSNLAAFPGLVLATVFVKYIKPSDRSPGSSGIKANQPNQTIKHLSESSPAYFPYFMVVYSILQRSI